jgi:N-acyl-D-aspartate/D-glutamate deacylase
VPSRFADRDEVEALFVAAGATGKGMVLATPGKQCSFPDFYALQPKIGRPFTWPLFAAPNGQHRPQLEIHEKSLERDLQVWPQVTPRPLTMQFTMADAYNLNVGKVFGELLERSREERIAAYRDPAWRARAEADLRQAEMAPRWDTFEVSESKRFPDLEGRRVVDLARERGCSPLDVMCEIAVEEDLTTRFRAYIANDEIEDVRELLTQDRVLLGLGDGGAHVDQLCDSPLYTDLLGRWVRERDLMPLERAVRKLSAEPADLFGFAERGYLREGYWADVCVFDPATVDPGPLRRVRDFPANGERLTADQPKGVRHVLVNGTPIRVDEESRLESLDRRPGVRPELD